VQLLPFIGVTLLGYVLGSIPFGYMLVRLATGGDIRDVHSGRSGGTNAMRAAGPWVGALTGVLDGLKAYSAVQVAAVLFPGEALAAALAAAAAVLGHNYSMFLVQRKEGRLVLGGGAGGAPVVGGATGIWLPSLYLILPIGLVIYYAWFGLTALLMLVWALRPNLKRLREGKERRHGFRGEKNM